MKRYFDVLIIINDGELEYPKNIVIEAEDLIKAKHHANLIARSWFNKPSFKRLGYWYFPEVGRSVKFERVIATDPERFLKSQLKAA